MSKLISRIVFEPSAEVKALLDDFKQTASDVIAACAKTHNPHQPTGELLDTMQDAANDSLADAVQTVPNAQQGLADWRKRNAKPRDLGQWIFEGQDKEWVSASFDEDGLVFLWNVPKSALRIINGAWLGGTGSRCREMPHTILHSDWRRSPINRESYTEKLRDLGQWIFEGQDEKYISAAVDDDGTPVLHTAPAYMLTHDDGQWCGDGQHLVLHRFTLNADNWTDSPIERETVEPELLKLGQWVFEGQDDKWQSAAVNSDGKAYLHNMPKSGMFFNHSSYGWASNRFDRHEMKLIDGLFNPSGFACVFIERETVNDVDYLSDDKQQIDEIALDDQRSRLLAESVPHVTPKDLQSLFISGLADLLIQRMHSQDRFSDDDYDILGADLMPWDVVFHTRLNAYSILIRRHRVRGMDLLVLWPQDMHLSVVDGTVAKDVRAITQDEIAAFKKALEVCYA